MEQLILCFEIIGVISFALAGAMTGLRKGMDIFGVCVLGLTTAVGGGIVRDLILGQTPPAAFRDPVSVLTAVYRALAIGLSRVTPNSHSTSKRISPQAAAPASTRERGVKGVAEP